MAGKDTAQDADRVHDAAGYDWTVTDVGTYLTNSQTTNAAEIAYQWKTDGAVAPAIEVRGNGELRCYNDAKFYSFNGIEAQRVTNPYQPSAYVDITVNGLYVSKFSLWLQQGITTADMLALTPISSYNGFTIRNSDKGCLYHCDGNIWFPLGKHDEFTTAQRLALNVLHYKNITVFDTDTGTPWISDGTNWIEL